MCKIVFIFLLGCISMFSQQDKEVTYNFGHNGMELVVTKNNETIIINNFNAKMSIREDIAQKILSLYDLSILTTDTIISVTGTEAKVTGKIIIEKKDKLTSINFYYEKIEWNTGLVEVYKKPK